MLQDRTVSTTLSDHENHIAASTSAGRILTNSFASLVQETVERSLADSEGYEYGISVARRSETGEFVIGGPSKGTKLGSITVGAPMNITVDNPEELPDELRGEVSCESTHRYQYFDLIKMHTHDTYDVPEVGLSYGDLADSIPVSDTFTASSTPYDVYRAQSAVVFTNDESRLPIQNLPEAWTTESHVFDEEQAVRPWLHLVERTPAALELGHGEADKLHYESMESEGDSHAERFRDALSTVNPYVAELLVPLAPSQ